LKLDSSLCPSAVDSQGRTIWIVDAHRDGKRFVVRVDAKPMAFLEMKRRFALVHELRLLIRKR
jgi:hypothetical protein